MTERILQSHLQVFIEFSFLWGFIAEKYAVRDSDPLHF